jgi:hypothetical protein
MLQAFHGEMRPVPLPHDQKNNFSSTRVKNVLPASIKGEFRHIDHLLPWTLAFS